MEAAQSISGSSTVAASAPAKAAKRTFLVSRARRLGRRSVEAARYVRNSLPPWDAAVAPLDIEQAPEPVFQGGSQWSRWERRLTGGTCLAATVVIFTVLVVTLLLTSGSHKPKYGEPRRGYQDSPRSTTETPWPWIGITNAWRGGVPSRATKRTLLTLSDLFLRGNGGSATVQLAAPQKEILSVNKRNRRPLLAKNASHY